MTPRTPLSAFPNLSAPQRDYLCRSWWITSLEEFAGLLKAPNQTYGSGLAELQQHDNFLPRGKLAALLAAAEATLAEPLDCAPCAPGLGALLDAAPAPGQPPGVTPNLPAEHLLPLRLPAPPDQGPRPAGLALALAALLQHLSGADEPLSAQFLLWAGALYQEDRDADLRLDAALRVLGELGLCRERTWRYDPRQPARVPPPGAVEEARQWRIGAPVWHKPDDGPILRTLLHGGQPVLLVLPVFQHWCDSWQALQLGRVRKALSGEAPLGQQALLAVGYRTDPEAPGGGYLIARNSWGAGWGRANPDGPGYAHIPYDLLKQARAALTLTLAPAQSAAPSAAPAAAEALPAGAAALLQEAQERLTNALPELERLQALVAQLRGQDPPKAAVPVSQPDCCFGDIILRSPGPHNQSDPLAANGIRASTGKLLLDIDTASAGRLARVEKPDDDPHYSVNKERHTADSKNAGMTMGRENDLRNARWAVVVHAQEDVALLKALTPLILKRCADQGLPAPALDDFREGETCIKWLARKVANIDAPFKGNSTMPVLIYRPGEDVNTWLARHGISVGPVNPLRGVPFYLLLVGRPGSPASGDKVCIPFSFQYALDVFWGVGRLCFTDPLTGRHDLDAYTRYAEQVVAFEQRREAPFGKHIVYFGTRHPLDLATRLSADELVQPLAGQSGDAAGLAARCGFSQDVFLAQDATHAQLERILRGDTPHGRPALLFSATHGVGLPPDAPGLAATQGALLCQDWPGGEPPRRQHWFAAEDLSDQTRVDGLFAFCFACYGVGSPQEDDYVFQAGQPRTPVAPYPLVARLPQQLLARGALAVLGHVDRAWSHSFRRGGVPAQTQSFESVLGRMMQGDRAGLATDQFNMMQGQLSSELLELLKKVQAENQKITDAELGNLWAARNDMRNYALLGDPAVRLPFGSGD